MQPPSLLYVGQESDRTYTPRLKSCVGTATVFVKYLTSAATLTEIVHYCNQKNIKGVFTSHTTLLQKLSSAPKPTLSGFAGSMFVHKDIEFLIIPPLEQLVTVSYAPFLFTRLISKLATPEKWLAEPEFNWELITPANLENVIQECKQAFLVAVDIETTRHNLGISHCGYAAVTKDPSHPSGLKISSFVLQVTDGWALSAMRRLNWEVETPKVLQNGKYDCLYFLRYNSPLKNFLYDTAVLFHSWYAELPKDLAYLSAFFIRAASNWKDLANSGDEYTYCMYNAKDIHSTALVFMRMLVEAPEWAVKNYLQKFPMIYPALLCEMTGMARDFKKLEEVSTQFQNKITQANSRLSRLLGVSNFNVNSPIQMKQLLKLLGCGDLESADEKHLEKAAYRHPLNRYLVDIVLDIRGWRKLTSTYLSKGKEFNDTATGRSTNRILYSLTPYGTDTGRNSSSESSFWCGLQLQNIPRGTDVKCTLIADPGFRIFEADLEQAESRDTAFIAGDDSLIEAVTGTRDFHSVNCASFFGVPYTTIYCDELKKTLNKALRDLAKRVNHGANYNMGANVLVETMTEAKVREAGRLLKLPGFWTSLGIANYLLDAFHRTYPKLKQVYYTSVAHEIVTTNLLQSSAVHLPPEEGSLFYNPSKWYEVGGWTRRCFSDPTKNKRAFNAYIAHGPQSLNAMTLDKAFMRVFYEIAMHPEHRKNFKLIMQIHDSILFQVRDGHEYLADRVKALMEIPVRVTGKDGKSRVFTVPSSIKGGHDGKGALRWSETE